MVMMAKSMEKMFEGFLNLFMQCKGWKLSLKNLPHFHAFSIQLHNFIQCICINRIVACRFRNLTQRHRLKFMIDIIRNYANLNNTRKAFGNVSDSPFGHQHIFQGPKCSQSS
jgi:hypothetical protein